MANPVYAFMLSLKFIVLNCNCINEVRYITSHYKTFTAREFRQWHAISANYKTDLKLLHAFVKPKNAMGGFKKVNFTLKHL